METTIGACGHGATGRRLFLTSCFSRCVTWELVATKVFEVGRAGFRKLDVLSKNQIPDEKALLSGLPVRALRCAFHYCPGLNGLNEVMIISVGVTPDPFGLPSLFSPPTTPCSAMGFTRPSSQFELNSNKKTAGKCSSGV